MEHLPGLKNIIAEEKSRTVRDRSDWPNPSKSVRTSPTANGSIRGGHVCFTTDIHVPVTAFLQWEMRPTSRGNRFICTELEGFLRICKPHLVPVVDNSIKNKGARSISPPDSPSLEDPAVVSTDSGDVGGFLLTSTHGGLGDISNREGVYHASQSSSVSCLAIVR